MMKLFWSCILLVPTLVHASEVGGVRQPNYYVSASYGNADDLKRYGLGLGANLPISTYLSAKFNVDYAKYNMDDTNLVDYNSKDFGVALQLRKFNLGSVELGYTRINSDFSDGVGFELDQDTYNLAGDYYYKNFTFGIGRGQGKVDSNLINTKFNSSFASAAWYPNENVKLSFGAAGMDAKDNYVLGIAYQPKVLNKSTVLSLSYNDSPDGDSVLARATYYFNSPVSLMKRDREY